MIAVGAEEKGQGIGRIRMCRIKDASAASLHPFVINNIESGSVIHTDGWKGYRGLDKQNYSHKVTVLRGRKAPLAMTTWITTWMSLRFGLIGAILGIGVSFFIDYYSRRYLWSR